MTGGPDFVYSPGGKWKWLSRRMFIIQFEPEIDAWRDHLLEEKEEFKSMNAAIEITSIDEAQELEPLEIARRLYDSAVARYAEGHIRLAESLFRRALYLFGKHYESGRSGAIGAMINLGVIYEDRFEYSVATQMCHRAVITVEGATGYGDTNLVQLRLVLWSYLAHINRIQGRHDQAEACARLRLEVAERFFGPDSLGAAD